MLRTPRQEINLLRCSSIHLHSPLYLDLDLMGWALWREWLEQKAFRNFLTTRRNASSTKERSARLWNTWIKFLTSAIVHHGPFSQTMSKIRWKRELLKYSHMQVFTICGPEKESCAANQALRDKNCLVPCSGLYADIADNSLQANMMAGRKLVCLEHWTTCTYQVSTCWHRSSAMG